MVQRKTWITYSLILAILFVVLSSLVVRRGRLKHLSRASVSADLDALLQQRDELDRTVWRSEQIAQRHEDVFVDLWDRLRAETDPFEVLADIEFETLVLHGESRREVLGNALVVTERNGDPDALSLASYKAFLGRLKSQGYRLVQSEWHHASFELDAGDGARSTFDVVLHAINPGNETRYIVDAELGVTWRPTGQAAERPRIRELEARNVRIVERQGGVAFEEVFQHRLRGPTELLVLVYDLDQDGLSEIVVPSLNLQFHNRGGFRFETQKFSRIPPARDLTAGVLADFTADGRVDFLCAGSDVKLYVADAQGKFVAQPISIQVPEMTTQSPSVITAGDVDGDGDLDVWLGQYKYPMLGGQMPSPYFDANDGYPSYLLQNEGDGRWADVTQVAGLTPKRNRRTYGASLIDLDGDLDLDLLVASDFAGLDAYQNDGAGHFQDVTDAFGDTRRAFGMSLTFGDYNLDGGLDFLMTGMGSTTARRLDRMGLGPDGFATHQANRPLMGYGNRLFLAPTQPARLDIYRQAAFNDQVARTGWTWGCTSLDFENDGDLDIYVANGHKSRTTAKDYCSRFWCHDIYIQNSNEDPGVEALFHAVADLELGRMSWNGFEHNCLLMNRDGEGFCNVGHLMNVALEEDSRNVISEDFDADGRVDLLVVSQVEQERRQTIRVMRNGLPRENHWIGVRLQAEPGRSPIGARIVVHANGRQLPAVVVTGDSFRSQHAAHAVFGLGSTHQVEAIDVRWPDGFQKQLRAPKVDAYHTILAQPAGHQEMLTLLESVRARTREENTYLGEPGLAELRQAVTEIVKQRPLSQQLHLLDALADHELRLGRERAAIKLWKRVQDSVVSSEGSVPNGYDVQIAFKLGVAFMRLGETQNCCARNTPDSCILPIQGAGIHTQREGSEKAIHYFTHVLESKGRWGAAFTRKYLLPARWLLNLAHMTLGTYPRDVPGQYLIPPEAFRSEVPFPRFNNVAQASGLDAFSTSGGAIGDDFDNDGDFDLLAAPWDPGGRLRYFQNRGTGTYEDRSAAAGLQGMCGGLNMLQADYDNDGYVDVLVMRGAWLGEAGSHPNSLLRNVGYGCFVDVTVEAGLNEVPLPTQTAAWADYDNDGDLDLYVGNESTGDVSAPCQLFRNEGKGRFTNVAVQAGVTNDRYAKAVVWGDYDHDRYPDLYVSNLGQKNRLYHNNRDGTFTDVARNAGVMGPRASFPAWFWDFNNDGHLDLYVSAYSATVGDLAAWYLKQPVDVEASCLYLGDGQGNFKDVTVQRGLARPDATMGANFGDLDNDGYLDFYLGTGYPRYQSLMPSVMYWNRAGKRFLDVTTSGGFGNLQKGHAVVFLDVDGDGDQDVFQQMGGAYPGDRFHNALYENPGHQNHWLSLRLVGVQSNRSAIGARILVEILEQGNRRTVYKHVNSGGSFGANPLRQTIGLGKASRIVRLEVFWPTSNITQTFHKVPLDRTLEIIEGRGG